MSASVFTNPTVSAYYKEHFINLKMDMESNARIVFGEQYLVKAYPTLLFIDGSGKIVYHTTGSLTAKEFTQVGKDAQDPDKQSSIIEQRLRQNLKTAVGVGAYPDYLAANEMPTDSLAETYFAGIKSADWMLVSNWLLLETYIQRADSPVIRHIETHRDEFNEGVDKKVVDTFLKSVYIHKIEALFEADSIDDKTYCDTRDRLMKVVNEDEIDQRRYNMDCAYFLAKKDTINDVHETVRYVEQNELTAALLTDYARFLYEDYANWPQAQAKARECVQMAVSLDETYKILSLYALIMHQAKQTNKH